MARGRKPKPRKRPSILRYIEGQEGLPTDEPTPDLASSRVPPPEHLSPVAAEHFTWAVRCLAHMRLLSVVDLPTVERYAQLREQYDQAVERCEETGVYFIKTVIDQESGEEVVVNGAETPWAKRMTTLSTHLQRIENDLGFNPTARASLSTLANEKHGLEEDSIEAFLAEGA